jgi:DNA polymerase III delta subunit
MFDPPDSNRLAILASPADKTPKRDSAFLKKMNQQATTVKFTQLTPGEAGRVVGARLQAEGLKIDENALKLMLELIAGNFGALQSEVEKIIHYKKDQGSDHVSVDDVKDVCSGFEMYTVFQLGQYVAERDVTRALKMVDQLISIQSGVSGAILYFLGEHFVLLYLLRNGKRLPGRRAWKAAQLRPQAEQFTSERLEEIILKIADTTARMRRKQADSRLAMEALVVELTGENA